VFFLLNFFFCLWLGERVGGVVFFCFFFCGGGGEGGGDGADWISDYYVKAILRGVNEFVSLPLTLFRESRRTDGRTLRLVVNEITLTHIP